MEIRKKLNNRENNLSILKIQRTHSFTSCKFIRGTEWQSNKTVSMRKVNDGQDTCGITANINEKHMIHSDISQK